MITVFLSVGSRYPVDRKLLRERTTKFLQSQHIFDATININVVGERKIKDLNERLIGHEGITDVLSFPQYDKGSEVDYESTLEPSPQLNAHGAFVLPPIPTKHLGDIVVCYPEIVRQAMKRGKMVDEHMWSLVEHGLGHLLGKHHE